MAVQFSEYVEWGFMFAGHHSAAGRLCTEGVFFG